MDSPKQGKRTVGVRLMANLLRDPGLIETDLYSLIETYQRRDKWLVTDAFQTSNIHSIEIIKKLTRKYTKVCLKFRSNKK